MTDGERADVTDGERTDLTADERADLTADERTDPDRATRNHWNSADYDGNHGFVHEYGESVVELLDPQPGERVLDLGCGTGHLTADIAEAVGPDGEVVGLDQSAEMVAQAREAYPELTFEQADATESVPEGPFDAVFSNATLHWIRDQDAVIERVGDSLAPGGRFVAELGGHGNVAHIVEAVLLELHERDHDAAHPWYFPTVGEHASRLEAHGFEVTLARLFDRPTVLDGGEAGLENWLAMFGDPLFAPLDESEHEAVVEAAIERCREALFDAEQGTWTADYRRLRFVATSER